jgi:hypothetical protein
MPEENLFEYTAQKGVRSIPQITPKDTYPDSTIKQVLLYTRCDFLRIRQGESFDLAESHYGDLQGLPGKLCEFNQNQLNLLSQKKEIPLSELVAIAQIEMKVTTKRYIAKEK